ncbi:MAG: ribosome silencing factor [Nitriliruptoraceae bacterium]
MPASDEAMQIAREAAEAADDVKATDLVLLEVADVLALADVFVLATAQSDRQLKAVGERIEARLREHGRTPLRREGSPAAGWMLIDYGDLVCHLFSEEMRATYALERLWADVPRHDVTFAPAPTAIDAEQA